MFLVQNVRNGPILAKLPTYSSSFLSKLDDFWPGKNFQTKHIVWKALQRAIECIFSFEIHHSWLKLLALKNSCA